MFKLGGSDDDEKKRDELRENIDKIRDMVKQREGRKDSQRRAGQQEQPDREPPAQDRQPPTQGDEPSSPGQQPQGRDLSPSGRSPRSSGKDLDVGEADIPEPPELKEIQVPDIERGPLFIRVQKFREAKRMVDDMYELGGELETEMAGLRNTLEEDKDVGRRIADTLKDMKNSLTTIKDIVSP